MALEKQWNEFPLRPEVGPDDTFLLGTPDGEGYRAPGAAVAPAGHSHENATVDADGFMSAADKAALNGKEDKALKGTANGYASLDASGKIPENQLPALAITDTFPVGSQAAMLALTAQVGDIAIRTDLSKSFVLRVSPATLLANWSELLVPTAGVTSVGLSVPTGFNPSGSPVTGAGDLGFAFAPGYRAYTDTEAGKLDGVAPNANNYTHPTADGSRHVPATPAASVNRWLKSGASAGAMAAWAVITKADVGLGNVENLAPADMPVSTATAAALNGKEDKALRGAANGYASLDASGKIPSAQLPPMAITEPFVVGSQATMLALTAQSGDVAIRSDISRTFMLRAEPASTLANWVELVSSTQGVMSVNGKAGPNVALTKTDVGLGNVENIAPEDMPISHDVQGALDEKVGLSGTQTLSNKTLKAPVIDGYTEGLAAASGIAFAPNLAAAAMFLCATTGNAIITMPAAVAGKSFVVVVEYGGGHTLGWAGAAIRWPDGTPPTPTSVNGKRDTFPFLCVDGVSWQPGGMNI